MARKSKKDTLDKEKHATRPITVEESPKLQAKEIEAALSYFRTRRPKSLYQTTVLKFHEPTLRRIAELLWTQHQVTNFSARLLELLDPRSAIACIHEMLKLQANGTKGDRTNILGEVISACFRPRKKEKLAFQPPLHHVIPIEEFPIVSGLRTGVYREIARMLLTWYGNIIGAVAGTEESDDEGEEDLAAAIVERLEGAIPSTEAIWAQWQEQWRIYREAASTIVPFGADKGKTLAEAGKDGIRWLEERLLSEDTIRTTLLHIEVLRNPLRYSDELQRQARLARHPYKRKASQDRKPQASRLVQRHADSEGPRVRLAFLSEREQGFLESELFEQQDHVAKFAEIREAVQIFLEQKPAGYPVIRPVPFENDQIFVQQQYDQTLNKLLDPFPKNNKDATTFSADTLHEIEKQDSRAHLAATRALAEPKLQPITYKRAMRPPTMAATFALLYRRFEPEQKKLEKRFRHLAQSDRLSAIRRIRERGESYEYVLVMIVHNDAAFNPPHNRERFTPKIEANRFYYVDFPETPFSPPERASLLVFPLEGGWDRKPGQYLQSDRLLQTHIHRQRKQQIELQQNDVSADGVGGPLSEYLIKRAPLGSVRITSSRNNRKHYEFFAHLSVPVPVPKSSAIPKAIIGFHEHNDGYTFAVVTLDGDLITAGDLEVPHWVEMRDGETTYRPNYAYEVALAMVKLAEEHKAYIGLEDTQYRKNNVSLSSARNRQIFTRPSEKVATTLRVKALLVGMLEPRRTHSVSYKVCGLCGWQSEAKSTGIILTATPECPECQSNDVILIAETEASECQACGCVWEPYDRVFSCEKCQQRRIARFNRAIVVAHRTREQLATHHKNSLRIATKRQQT